MAKSFEVEVSGEWSDALEAVDIEMAISAYTDRIFVVAKAID